MTICFTVCSIYSLVSFFFNLLQYPTTKTHTHWIRTYNVNIPSSFFEQMKIFGFFFSLWLLHFNLWILFVGVIMNNYMYCFVHDSINARIFFSFWSGVKNIDLDWFVGSWYWVYIHLGLRPQNRPPQKFSWKKKRKKCYLEFFFHLVFKYNQFLTSQF